MSATKDEIDRAFAGVFNNGRGEVGLEVGVDPGLSEDEYIRIPRSMLKPWAARVAPAAIDDYVANGAAFGMPAGSTAATPIPGRPADPSQCVGLFGWVTQGMLTVVEGSIVVSHGGHSVVIEDFYVAPPTHDDAVRFLAVNVGHIRDREIPDTWHNWVHAVRFWSVAAGLVTVNKNDEYIVVDDPADIGQGPHEFARFCSRYAPNAYTAAAARAGTWRKTNHATGGVKASGFARRWLQKEGYIGQATERNQRDRELKAATDAFYVATHATSVHAVLALMAPEDPGHWATINPSCGFVHDWSIKSSVKMRLAPMTQVAGGAMVADAMVTLHMVVREGLAPLLNHSGQAVALKAQYDVLAAEGVACATFAGWFLDGHPLSKAKRDFSQKDSSAASLIGELGCVASLYYRGTTIGESPSLAAAASQLGDPVAFDTWGALAAEKKTMSAEQIVRAYGAIRGGATTAQITNLLSDDEAEVRAAVEAYNHETAAIAAVVGVANPQSVSAESVIRNRALVAATPGGA